MANDGKVVGDPDNFGPSTWGALRSIIFNWTTAFNPDSPISFAAHNAHYIHGFKTTEGNGYIRTDYTAIFTRSSTPVSGPNFNYEALTASPPASRFGSLYSGYGDGSSSGMLDDYDRTQLTGETVTLSSGSLTIASSAFVAPYYQVDAHYSATPLTITAIGKLTAF